MEFSRYTRHALITHLFLFALFGLSFLIFRFLPIECLFAIKRVWWDGNDQRKNETGSEDVDSLRELLNYSSKNKPDKTEKCDN